MHAAQIVELRCSHALAIRIKLFGEDHESTAANYRELAVTQCNMHDYSAAIQSLQTV